MKLDELTTVSDLSRFLEGTQAVAFSVEQDKAARYRWIQEELIRFHYQSLSKKDKGVLIRYLMRISGYSRQQLTRLIPQYRQQGRIHCRQRTVAGFKRIYTDNDIRLLVEMDKRHDAPCGQAINKLCERAVHVFGQEEYRNLAGIPVSHLYNLRKSRAYTRQRQHFEKTRPRASSIGERRKPQA